MMGFLLWSLPLCVKEEWQLYFHCLLNAPCWGIYLLCPASKASCRHQRAQTPNSFSVVLILQLPLHIYQSEITVPFESSCRVLVVFALVWKADRRARVSMSPFMQMMGWLVIGKFLLHRKRPETIVESSDTRVKWKGHTTVGKFSATINVRHRG